MIEVDNKFEIGEECWTYYREKLAVDCPVCKGTKKIKYNGYELICKQCDSKGKVATNQTIVKCCKVKIGRIIASIWENTKTVKYKVHPSDMFISIRNRSENTLYKTKEECEKVCMEINQGIQAGSF